MPESVSDRPMHVVQILEATAGGTRTHILQILRGLGPPQFRFTLIASTHRNPGFRRDIEDLRSAGVHVVEVPMVRRVAPLRDLASLWRVWSALRSLDVDLVHTHASKAGVLGRIAARLCGIRSVLHTPHVFYFQGGRGLSPRLFRLVERAMLPLTARLILLSEPQRRLAVGELGMDPAGTVVLENGVDADRFSPRGQRACARRRLGIPTASPAIGTISRLVPQKACDVFLRAVKRVLADVPDCACVLVGDGPLRDRMRRLAQDLGLGGRITWVAHTDDSREIYEALDVFVLSSRYEGMPYTLLEAMAMGLPVVATRVPGTAEVVRHGTTGLLVEPDDPESLAAAVLRLLGSPEQARRMGAEGRARVAAHFTLERFLRGTARVYAD